MENKGRTIKILAGIFLALTIAVVVLFYALSSTKIDVKDKSNQQRENDERIAEFIRKHAVDLYDYIYRIKRIRENTKQDKVDQVYFYRGEIDLSGSDPINSNPENNTGCFRFK